MLLFSRFIVELWIFLQNVKMILSLFSMIIFFDVPVDFLVALRKSLNICIFAKNSADTRQWHATCNLNQRLWERNMFECLHIWAKTSSAWKTTPHASWTFKGDASRGGGLHCELAWSNDISAAAATRPGASMPSAACGRLPWVECNLPGAAGTAAAALTAAPVATDSVVAAAAVPDWLNSVQCRQTYDDWKYVCMSDISYVTTGQISIKFECDLFHNARNTYVLVVLQ